MVDNVVIGEEAEEHVVGREKVQYFREENINLLMEAIKGDDYNDSDQYAYRGEIESRYPGITNFLVRNVKQGSILEIGPGSGDMIDIVPADFYLDPCARMLVKLKENLSKRSIKTPIIREGVVECIPWDLKFTTIFFINGFYQIRSTNEALIEVNRHLEIGGRFVFNIKVDDSEDVVCGRVYGPDNYLRNLREYGFEPIEVRRDSGYFALEKVREFKIEYLRKLQLFPHEDGTWSVYNLCKERDWAML